MSIRYKILSILLILCSFARAQFPVDRGLPTVQVQDAFLKVKLGLSIPVVADTTHGLNGGHDSLGLVIQIRSTGDWYKRDTTPGKHKWTLIGSGTGSPNAWGSITGTLSSQTDLQSALNGKQNSLGYTPIAPADTAGMLATRPTLNYIQANFYPLSSNPAAYLTSNGLPNVVNSLQVINTGGVDSYAAGIYSSRPSAGTPRRFYFATDSLKIYYDNGSTWLTVAGSGGGGGTSVWGGITGTLSSQTDLQNALNLKLNISDTGTWISKYLRVNVAAATYFPIPTGTTSQVLLGNGTAATPDTGLIANFAAKVRSEFRSGSYTTYNNGTYGTDTTAGKVATQTMLGLYAKLTDARFAPVLSLSASATADTFKINTGTGVTLPAATNTNAGAFIPGYKKQLDSLNQYRDSLRFFFRHDSLFACITPASTGIEACNFQDTVPSVGGTPSGAIVQLTGDVLTGTTGGIQSANLAIVNSNTGTFGDATHVAQVTYDAKGRATAVANVLIAATGTNLGNTPASGNLALTSSSGSGTTIPGATESAAGVMTAAQVQTLDHHLWIGNARTAGSDSLAYSKLSSGAGVSDSMFMRELKFTQGIDILISDQSTTNSIVKTFSVDTTAGSGHVATQGLGTRTFVPLTRNITINGVTQQLNADPSFTVGAGFTDPETTLGDMIYRGASAATRLAGNTTLAKQFLTQTGTGTISAAPSWYTPVGTDFISIGAFGSTPNANGLSLTVSSLVLQPADPTHPGGMTTGNQSFAGTKSFANAIQQVSLTQNGGLLYNNGTGVMQQSSPLSGYVFGNGASAPTASTTIPGTAITGNIAGSSGNVTGIVAPANGGFGVSLAATGGAGQYAKQTTVGGNLSLGSIPESDLVFTNITTNNASTSKHGFLPILSNDATQFINGLGNWVSPVISAAGTANQITVSSATGAVTFGLPNNVNIIGTLTAAVGSFSGGSITVPTKGQNDNSSNAASTAYVDAHLPAVRASADVTAQTATNSSIATYTPPADGDYSIGGYVVTTAASGGQVLFLQATYTDETNTARTYSFPSPGTTSPNVTGVGFIPFNPIHVRCKGSTAITVRVTFNGVGSNTYDAGGIIEQLK